MYTIRSVHAREVLDSRGNPTIEVEMTVTCGEKKGFGRAIVPSGASTGTHEALELRDNDTTRYLGKGVLQAVRHVHEDISPVLVDASFPHIFALDTVLLNLDGTPNKSRLGANAMLGCSMAFCVACADAEGLPLFRFLTHQAQQSPEGDASCQGRFTLPIPLMNILNGGVHADNALDFQELMIIPEGAPTLCEAVRMGAEVFHHLKKILKKAGYATSVGDEGGYAPNVQSNREALGMILEAIQSAGYSTQQIKIGLDVASSEFYREGKYCFEGDKQLDYKEMTQYYLDLVREFPIVSIEDGFAEDDFAGRAYCQKTFEENGLTALRTVGDDLYVTNVTRLQQGIDQHLSNSILIKLNQIGTVSETINCVHLAHTHGLHSIISHRSGETEDTFIADLAVALGSKYIKTGSLSRSDRIAKYNQLIRIEEQVSH